MRALAGIDLGSQPVPDATTLLGFRHLLAANNLTRALLAEVNAMLEERGVWLRESTIIDATIIAAPSSTKNQERARDPKMRQVKKGNVWHFGIKAHNSADFGRALHVQALCNPRLAGDRRLPQAANQLRSLVPLD